MQKLISLVTFFIIAALATLLTQTGTSCQKPADTITDTIAPPPSPPPPPITDTVTYVKKIEEFYFSGINAQLRNNRDFTFYYDNLKRVTLVGIKNYGPVLTDSLNTRFFYSGNSIVPYMVIMPQTIASQFGGPSYYDTTWITYGANNLPIKDSCTDWCWNNTTNTLEHRLPLIRQYTYLNNTAIKIDWYATVGWGPNIDIFRRDTVWRNTNGVFEKLKAHFYYDHDSPGSYTNVEALIYSGIVNPLSKLNISGPAFSPLYSPVKEEILGSRFHWVVYTGNPLPYYLDFCSAFVPNSFFLASYNRLGSLLNSGAIAFWTEITPWPQRTSYPAEIKVRCSYSLAGDEFRYKYSYY